MDDSRRPLVGATSKNFQPPRLNENSLSASGFWIEKKCGKTEIVQYLIFLSDFSRCKTSVFFFFFSIITAVEK
jgi:hypothetical protein